MSYEHFFPVIIHFILNWVLLQITQHFIDHNILYLFRQQRNKFLYVFVLKILNSLVDVFFVCLFGVFRPTRELFTHLDTSPLPVTIVNFDLCPALMAIEQLGFFSLPHLLWHGASVYNGYLRGPVTLRPIAEPLAVELSLSVLMT